MQALHINWRHRLVRPERLGHRCVAAQASTKCWLVGAGLGPSDYLTVSF